MKSSNRITPEDIKNVAKMSDKEMESKLKEIFSSGGNIKSILSGIDTETVKKQIQSKSPAELSKIVNNLEKIDPKLLEKIKNSIK